MEPETMEVKPGKIVELSAELTVSATGEPIEDPKTWENWKECEAL